MLNLIKQGDMSTAVYKLQTALQRKGMLATADGSFGPATASGLIIFQRSQGLTADGVAGPATIAALGLDLRPTTLTDADFNYAAGRLGVEAKVVKAITQIEAPRGGFNADGTPVILYERHYFYKQFIAYKNPGQTQQSRIAERNQITAANRDICWPSALTFAKTAPAYDRYGSTAQQYTRLNRARKFSDSAALESASWGKFQIMGENWSRIGWSSVQAFHRAMCASERDHLDAFIGFCFSKPGLVNAIRNKNWELIAKLYNGAAQVAYYAPRLRNAYNAL